MLKSKTTQSCRSHSHPEIEVEYESTCALDQDIDWFLSGLEDAVARGTKYEPGQYMQTGWMLSRIDADDDHLTLSEPDFVGMPIRFVRGITNTIRHLRLQKSVAESVGLEDKLSFPNIQQSGIVCSRHQDSMDFLMDRTESAKHSGWFVGCLDVEHNHDDPANLRRVSLYELALAKPDCVPFMALPPDCLVCKNANAVDIFFKKEALRIKPDSYLAQRMERGF